jgi:hypothetical protein
MKNYLEQRSFMFEKQEAEVRQKARVVVMMGSKMEQGVSTKKGQEGQKTHWQFPWIVYRPRNEQGKTIGAGRPDDLASGFSRLRALEAYYHQHQVSRPDKDFLVLVTGGWEYDEQKKKTASRAKEAQRLLTRKHGLPEKAVDLAQSESSSTLGNVESVLGYLETHRKRLGDVQELEILTNEWHSLRSWLMFQKGIYEKETGGQLKIKEVDFKKVKEILDQEIATDPEIMRRQIKERHAQVQNLLQPYFDGLKPQLKNVTVEEVLEKEDGARQRYAGMLIKHPLLRERMKLEHQGIIDLLRGRYEKLQS